ncbi:MAG: hypothetical protein AABZ31_11795, partial [Bdellovibrionota bacterium]
MFSLLLFLLPVAFAKTLSTPYLVFNVPDTYVCQAKAANYQCQDSIGPRMKDSILVATFKKNGPQDSIEQYVALLSKPFTRVNQSGPPALSQVISVKKVMIKNFEWVHAKHYESDLSNYYTYYWSTVRGPVAMVVKYSVLKKSDQTRQKDIQMISSSLETRNVQFAPPPAASPAAQSELPTPALAAAAAQYEGQGGVVQKVMNLPPTQRYLVILIAFAFILLVVYAVAKR